MNATASDVRPGLASSERAVLDEALPTARLQLLNTYIRELVREAQLGQRAELTLQRLSLTLFAMSGASEAMLCDRQHPARSILDTTARIAQLSKEQFEPGQALYQTLQESLRVLRSARIKAEDALVRVNADLQHVLKLAKIRASSDARTQADELGKVSHAKLLASSMIMRHSQRGPTRSALLYFALTDWLEMLTVTILKNGEHSKAVKTADRLTLALFYLNASDDRRRKASLRAFLEKNLPAHVAQLGWTCLGHPIELRPLVAKARALTAQVY